MSERKKILIAHDGSDSSVSMLDDLQMAGLPGEIEAIVLTVAELWLPPPPTSYGLAEANYVEEYQSDGKLAETLASQACGYIKAHFQNWDVRPETVAGSPATAIIRKADQWRPDLIIVGSQGHTALGRFFFGSVSQKVVTEARCSVRVARGRIQEPDSPVRLIIGVDGSADATAAVEEVASRVWPKGSEARLVTSTDSGSLAGSNNFTTSAESVSLKISEVGKSGLDYVMAIQKVLHQSLEAELRAAGLVVSSVIKQGDPKRILISEAQQWGADCIFVGSRGLGPIKRFLLGSVSTAVVARAHCSVEVVRK